MKSIMEEASSIFKAIEAAWKRAGEPRNFSIKIFEEPQKNFFGMTVKSAKIGFFFDEKSVTPASQKEQRKPKKRPSKKAVPRHVEKIKKTQAERPVAEKKQAPTEVKSEWSEEMIAMAQNWVRMNFKLAGMPDVPFTITPSKYHLRFEFEKMVLSDSMKQKTLFRSFAHLIMASLRNKLKKELRGLKVVLSCR